MLIFHSVFVRVSLGLSQNIKLEPHVPQTILPFIRTEKLSVATRAAYCNIM